MSRPESHIQTNPPGPVAPSSMRVRVIPKGPYVVSGQVPLVRRQPVISEYGEPLTWVTTAQIDAPASYALCRCGQSHKRPFCDGTHAAIGFDGIEAAATSSYDSRARTYPGVGITMRDDRSICEHAGFCGTRVTNVWEMVPETGDTTVRSELIAMVERCPSGALTYAIDGQTIEPDFRPAIGVIDNGPLAITGGIAVERADGSLETRARMTLCRCGQSANKPFCDGSHTDAGFRESGAEEQDGH